MKMNFAKKATALAMSVLFAVSMAGCGSSASTAKKVEVTSVEDLADLKIGVQTGTTGDSQASDAVNADSQMQRYNKGADAIQALKNGKIDCVVIDSLPAEKFVAANDDLKIVEGIFDTEEYAMCFKKGNELRDEFNTALAELKEDGTLDEIMSNYIGDEVGQHHGHAHVSAVGVDAHQLLAGEGAHLGLCAVQGVGGQLGGGVAFAPCLLGGAGVPSAGDGGAAAAVLDGGNNVGIRAGLEAGVCGDVQNGLRYICTGSIVQVEDSVDAVL